MILAFHLGYPRTGTTFLQTHLFPKHKQINYLGPKVYNDTFKVKIDQSMLNIIEEENASSDFSLNLFDEKKVNLVSSERYLSYRKFNYVGLKKLAYLVKNYFPNSKFKVFYTIRNQFDIIQSYYYQSYGYLSRFLDCRNFIDLIEKIEKRDFKNKNFKRFIQAFNFEYSYNLIYKEFDFAEIKIFSFKELTENKNNYIKNLSNFIEINDEESIKLCSNISKINSNTIVDKKRIMQSNLQRIISDNSYYKKIKHLIPKKIVNFTNSLLNKTISSKIDSDLEIAMRKTINDYYNESNQNFRKKAGVNIFDE